MVALLNVAAGATIGVGLVLIVVGLVFLVRAMLLLQKGLTKVSARIGAKGVIGDIASLVTALTDLINKVGVSLGIPLVLIILGIVIVAMGAVIAGMSL